MRFAIAVRFVLLQKRLFQKYSFVLLLCLAPLFAAGVGRLAKEPGSLAVIALYLPEGDASASEVAGRLLSRPGLFRYLSCRGEAEARELVESGEADAAWIFSENMEEELTEYAGKRRIRPVVTVVERQDSVPLILAREILAAAVYPSYAYEVYAGYVKEELGMEEVSDETLKDVYEEAAVEGSLFQMVYSDKTPGEAEDFTYVQAPFRGILSIWFTFAGLSAALYFMQDEERGVWGRVPATRRLYVSYGTGAVFLVDAAVVFLLSCKLAGVFTDWKREVTCCGVFLVCVLAFANLLRLLGRTPRGLGLFFLPLAAAMLALCPVFVNLPYFKAGKMLLPPWYYLQSIHNVRYLYGMAAYAAVLVLVSIVVQKLQNRIG